jgi:CheY-like chemotaxis protein
VLCVDDNPDVADSEVELLCLAGFDARACYDGPTALGQARAFRPAACLIDLHMPGMDGDELAARLRALDGALVLVAVTAMSDAASRRRVGAAGFARYLIKPVDPRELVSAAGGHWGAKGD